MLLKNSDVLKIVWKDRLTVALAILFCIILGLIFENARTPSFITMGALAVSTEGGQKTTDFNYDHYYSMEAVDSLTDSLEEWLKNPAVLSEAKNLAKTNFRSADWRFWENGNWKIRKKAPQLLEVSFYTETESGAKQVEKALKKQTEIFLQKFNLTGEPRFSLTNPSFALESKAPRYAFIIILSAIWGIILGGLLALERENLKLERKKKVFGVKK